MKKSIAKCKNSIRFLTVLLILSAFHSICYADYAPGGRPSGIFKAYYDSSVSSYGYPSSFTSGRNNWAGITSNVGITQTTSTSNYPDKYYVGTSSVDGRYGTTVHYRKNILGQIVKAYRNETWLYSTASLFHNQIEDDSVDPETVATHEIGHSLALEHTYYSSEDSIMYEYIEDCTDYVTTYDEGQLIDKWGN